MMKRITIILDAGHGECTPGKRSPKTADGRQLFEWQFTRELSRRIKLTCEQLRIKCIQANTDNSDPGLSARANNINSIVRKESELGNQCLMISLHGNAASSNGQWSKATGWEVWTTEGTTKSDEFAKLLCKHFPIIFPDKKLRGHKEKNFTLIYKCSCPCVLTENFFYDCIDDFELMMSEEGLQKITDLHIAAICDYIEYGKI
jgi:N-acetylmuramoyl-L-alanine amidase